MRSRGGAEGSRKPIAASSRRATVAGRLTSSSYQGRGPVEATADVEHVAAVEQAAQVDLHRSLRGASAGGAAQEVEDLAGDRCR